MATKPKFTHLLTLIAIFAISAYAQLNIGDSCTINSTKQPGICKSAADCPTVQQEAQIGIPPTLCGFAEITNPIVCCKRNNSVQPNDNSFLNLQPSDAVVFQEEAQVVSLSTPGSISKKKCKEYNRYVSQTIEVLPLLTQSRPVNYEIANCKFDGIPLIVGGEPANPGEFPFMAALGYPDASISNKWEWRCGGTLISENFILTAAHCVRRERPAIVRLGELNLEKENDGLQDYRIDRILLHPRHSQKNSTNDIALVRLIQRVTFTAYIRPACLSTGRVTQKTALATGWGKTDFSGDESTAKLLKVSIKLYTNEFCDRYYRQKYPGGLYSTQMCAGGNGNDTCLGDSGGPLLITAERNQCEFTVIGITSFGKSCGLNPSVYTRVSEYIPWIEENIW